MPDDACPRRYCWWWVSLGFEWAIAPHQGCTFLNAAKPPEFRFSDIPCCRSEPSFRIDHFEPREPHLQNDGVDPSRWLRVRDAKARTAMEEVKPEQGG